MTAQQTKDEWPAKGWRGVQIKVARLCRSGRRSTSNKNREKGLHALCRDQVGISTCTAASRYDEAKQEHKNYITKE
jgi:hypothetical protein